jgi:hypothetical protein
MCTGDTTAAAVVANTPKRYIPREFCARLVSDPAVPGETLARRITRMGVKGTWKQGVKRGIMEFGQLFVDADKCNWTEKLELVRSTLAQTPDENGAPQETDSKATAAAVLEVAARFSDYADFAAFVDETEKHVQDEDPYRAVSLITIHQAKGLEWDDVYVDVTSSLLPHKHATGKQILEELRLMYVAMSRARDRLFLNAAVYSFADDPSEGPAPRRGFTEEIVGLWRELYGKKPEEGR